MRACRCSRPLFRIAMAPTSQPSLTALRRLHDEVAQRGDSCLALLLSGIDLYVRMGREYELLELIRANAEELRESVAGTPTAEDLQRLFDGSV